MKNLINYIFPYRCLSCDRIISTRDMPLCISCYSALSFSHEKLDRNTITAKPLLQHKAMIGAASLITYIHGNVAQKLLHANKYYNQPHVGSFMAKLAIPILKNIEVDAIAIVPSHKKTMRDRGYNQVEVFAQSIASELDKIFLPDLLIRVHRDKSQIHRNKQQRMDSLKDAFIINQDISPYDKILFVDDVMTTGSTLNFCLSTILANDATQIYVLVMARVE